MHWARRARAIGLTWSRITTRGDPTPDPAGAIWRANRWRESRTGSRLGPMSITGNEDCWATFRESSNPMVLIDENRRIIEANPAMRALTGRSVAESVGH